VAFRPSVSLRASPGPQRGVRPSVRPSVRPPAYEPRDLLVYLNRHYYRFRRHRRRQTFKAYEFLRGGGKRHAMTRERSAPLKDAEKRRKTVFVLLSLVSVFLFMLARQPQDPPPSHLSHFIMIHICNCCFLFLCASISPSSAGHLEHKCHVTRCVFDREINVASVPRYSPVYSPDVRVPLTSSWFLILFLKLISWLYVALLLTFTVKLSCHVSCHVCML